MNGDAPANGWDQAERPVYANGVDRHGDGQDALIGDVTRLSDAEGGHQLDDTRPMINGSHNADENEDAAPNRFTRPYVPTRWLAEQDNEAQAALNGDSLDPPTNGISGRAPYAPRFKLTGHRNHVSAIRFSQDGRWMATAGASSSPVDVSVDSFFVQPETVASCYSRSILTILGARLRHSCEHILFLYRRRLSSSPTKTSVPSRRVQAAE